MDNHEHGKREASGGNGQIPEASAKINPFAPKGQNGTGELEPEFIKNVLAFENAPRSTLLKRLQDDGITVPRPDELNETAVHEKLWEIIRGLAARNVFLCSTNHLRDRELYALLHGDLLAEEYEELGPEWNIHLDILGGGSEEDVLLYQKYYADDECRRQFIEEYPGCELPEREDPPCDRDRLLPQPE